MSDLQKVGSDWGGAGSFKAFSAGTSGAQRITDAHGRFMDAAQAGRLFGGVTNLSISNVSFTTATLSASNTPIIGLYNPIGSGKALVLLQAYLQVVMTALQATGPGGFLWLGQFNQNISTGSNPVNRSSFATPGGSVAKYFNGAVALTGLTPNLLALFGSSLGGGSAEAAAFLATAAGMQTQAMVSLENFDGSLILYPGMVISLACTVTPVAHNAVGGLLWEEIPLLVQV